MKKLRQGSLVLGCLFSVGLYGQIYTWVDDQGVTHYSNQASHLDQQAEKVSIKSANNMDSVTSKESTKKVVKKKMESKASTKKAPLKQTARNDSARQCESWRTALTSLKQDMRKGYRLKKANELKQKKRNLRDKLWRNCR